MSTTTFCNLKYIKLCLQLSKKDISPEFKGGCLARTRSHAQRPTARSSAMAWNSQVWDIHYKKHYGIKDNDEYFVL
jgi:hypothetical protein